MSDPRYRYPQSGRRSPTFNPARASLPVSIGYNAAYSGDLHAIPTARYDSFMPRYPGDPRAPMPPPTTVTTYNVTKEPIARSSSHNEHRHTRHRSSTLESRPAKPIIVTTNHAKPTTSSHHSSSSHQSSSNRTSSPSRDHHRSSEETYYAQPASSHRSRSAQRHGHGHSQSATFDNDEFYRLRERVGDDRLRAPLRTGTLDPYRPSHHQSSYTNSRHNNIGYEDDGYEYTKPSDLARYDLDNDHSRRGPRESFDRPYHRPTVNVVSNEPGRFESRGRKAPPTASGLDRYNRAAASGIYDRPSVTVPALAAGSAAPVIDSTRRLEAPVTQPMERSASKTRPSSMYQDSSSRMAFPDDHNRARDDERLHKDRRDDIYRDDAIASRGFGIRTDAYEPAERRGRRDPEDREYKRSSDETLDRARSRSRVPPADTRPKTRVDDNVERQNSTDSKESGRGERVRDKVASGLSVAAAAIGLGALKDRNRDEDKDAKISPRRHRDSSVGAAPSRAAEKYRPVDPKPPRDDPIVVEQQRRARDAGEQPLPRRESPDQAKLTSKADPVVVEQRRSREDVNGKVSAKDDPIVSESRREPPKDRTDARPRAQSVTRDRETERDRQDRDRDRDREKEKERARERDIDRERERDRDRRPADTDRDRHRRETEDALSGNPSSARRDSPPTDDAAETTRRRTHRASAAAFDPLDTKGLMDLKAELAAKESADKQKEQVPDKTRTSDPALSTTSSDKRSSREPEPPAPVRTRDSSQSPKAYEETRGRDPAPVSSDDRERQVRVVSPPRDKSAHKPIKGILKQPTRIFPEEDNPVREGVAPHKDDKTKKDVPSGARWTKVNRRMVNPEALTIGKERFEVRDDFVIVLRVLSKEEIQAYATATAQLREMRRKQAERDGDRSRDYDDDRDRSDDDRRRRRDHPRRDRDDVEEPRGSGRDRDDRDRHRRRRGDSDEEEQRPKMIGYSDDHEQGHSRHRSHRHDDGEPPIASGSSDRR